MTTFAQGEIYGRKVESRPENLKAFKERDGEGLFVISHSKKGNHHLLDADGVEVLEATDGVPPGLRILYAIVKSPEARLWQRAAKPHEQHVLTPGIYELRIKREFDPIMKQARRVAD